MNESFDVIILGGGPGGYVAALRSAQLGLKVCLIEKESLGGVCLNKGCIPSKTLLAGTELFSKIQKASEWGITLQTAPIWNLTKLLQKKEDVIVRMRQGLESLCQKREVFQVHGEGVLDGPSSVRVDKSVYSAKYIILATGSAPRALDFGIGASSNIFSSQEALSPARIPNHLLVLGGGPEGCELALIYKGLGSSVTLVEAKERLLPGFDRDAGAAIKRSLLSKGIDIQTGDMLLQVVKKDDKFEASLKSGPRMDVDALLVSVGRVPQSQGLGLEKIGVRTDEAKAVGVDEALRTNIQSIFAIGDVTGKRMMAHSASYEGYEVANRIAGVPSELNYEAVPSCVYTYPEVAEVGLNEEKAKEKNVPYEIGRFSFMALGRSHAKGQTEGFVKVIGHAKTGQVLGGVIVGESAPELINVFCLAIRQKLNVEDLRKLIAPHPSASEAIVEASHLFFKEGLHFA